MEKTHNKELRGVHSSPDSTVRVIRSTRMRWAGHVARTARRRRAYRVLVRKR